MCNGFLCLISTIKQRIGLLSIKCSLLWRSSKVTVTVTSKSITTLKRHVSIHHTYWWDVWKIGTSSAITTWVVHSKWAFIFCNGYFIQLFICIWNKQLFSCKSNHGRTKLLDKNKLTIIEVGRSHFYNDNTNSLNNEVSQSTMWSYLGKHTFELAHSYFRSLRMRM